MAIILCGCDKVGKTSLARKLLQKLPGYSYRHFTSPVGITTAYRYFAWQIADAHPRMILDRFHLSDWAYGHVYRGGPELTPHQWRLLELSLLALDAKVLLLTDRAERIRERWGPEEMYGAEGIEALQNRYWEVAFHRECPYRTRLPVRVGNWADYEREGLGALVGWLGLPTGPTSPPALVVGSARAGFLVLGEAPPPSAPLSDERGSDPDLPFSRGPAAAWLWRALDELGVRWWEGAYANAASFATVSDFGAWLSARHGVLQRIVCLGDRAADLCVEARDRGWIRTAVQVFCTWHPSYVKRFRHREFPAWKAELGAALAPHLDAPRNALASAGLPVGWDVEVDPEWEGD